jgi:hypothetical protein
MKLTTVLLLLCSLTGIDAGPKGSSKSPKNSNTPWFVGLWAGVDGPDGSFTQRTLTCGDADCNTVTIVGADAYFSLCSATSGRGKLTASGSFNRGSKCFNVTDLTITCEDNSKNVSGIAATYCQQGPNSFIEDATKADPAQLINFFRISC